MIIIVSVIVKIRNGKSEKNVCEGMGLDYDNILHLMQYMLSKMIHIFYQFKMTITSKPYSSDFFLKNYQIMYAKTLI